MLGTRLPAEPWREPVLSLFLRAQLLLFSFGSAATTHTHKASTKKGALHRDTDVHTQTHNKYLHVWVTGTERARIYRTSIPHAVETVGHGYAGTPRQLMEVGWGI